jgi:hypothetical protein
MFSSDAGNALALLLNGQLHRELDVAVLGDAGGSDALLGAACKRRVL